MSNPLPNFIPCCDRRLGEVGTSSVYGRSPSAVALRCGTFLRIRGSDVVYRLRDIYEQEKGGNRLSIVGRRAGKDFGACRNVNSIRVISASDTDPTAAA